MSENFFTIRPYYDSIGLSTIVDLYNSTARYLNPETVMEITEELAQMVFGKDTVLSRDFILFEDRQKKVIGFAGVTKLPPYKDVWFVIYGIIPDYFQSDLPEKLIKAVLELIKDRDFPELFFQTIGELSAPFETNLEKLGFKPIHFTFFMSLEDFNLSSQHKVPRGIVIRNKKEIDDYNNTIYVLNEAFKYSFKFEALTGRKWKKIQDALRKSNKIEYTFAYEKDKLVGLCNSYFNPNQTHIGYIGDLGVFPSHQGRNIGSALLTSAINLLTKKGCTTINLEVEAKNENALRLYEKLGFYQKKNLTTKLYKII